MSAVTASLNRAMRPPTMARIDNKVFHLGSRAPNPTSSNLATATAAWLLVELLEKPVGVPNELGGARDWRSVACRNGCSRAHRSRASIGLVARAVDHDPSNMAARFGHASMTVRAAKPNFGAQLPCPSLDGTRVQANRDLRNRLTAINSVLRLRLAYATGAIHLQLAILRARLDYNRDNQSRDVKEARDSIRFAERRLRWLFRQVLLSQGVEPSDVHPRFGSEFPAGDPAATLYRDL